MQWAALTPRFAARTSNNIYVMSGASRRSFQHTVRSVCHTGTLESGIKLLAYSSHDDLDQTFAEAGLSPRM